MHMNYEPTSMFRGTTICAVKKDGVIAVAGDGQVTMGEHTIMKATARKVRRIFSDKVVVGFAGSVADAFALSEKFEDKLTQYSGNLPRAAVELAQSQFHLAGLDLHHGINGTAVAHQRFPGDDISVFHQILTELGGTGHGLKQQRVVSILCPGGGREDRGDGLSSHSGNGNGVHLFAADIGQAVAKAVFDLFCAVCTAGEPRALQGAFS